MYAAYQLINFDPYYFSEFVVKGAQTEETTRREVRSSLDTFLTPTGSVDAGKMMDEWFPDIKANVFISHSRADKNLALGLSGFLSSIGLTPFVDSSVWQHANSLLMIIDEECCKTGPNLFSYEGSLVTASHVHMMLATALTKMMDRCECIFFLNTLNSISARSTKAIVEGGESVTHSAWLFHEISMLKLLRKRPISDHRVGTENFSEGKKIASASIPRFDYPTELSGIPSISQNQITEWSSKLPSYYNLLGSSSKHPMDSLYGINPPHNETKVLQSK